VIHATDEDVATLKEALSKGFTDKSLDRCKGQIDSLANDLVDEIEWQIKGEMAGSLVAFCRSMANDAVKALLEGNEYMMRDYLNCRLDALCYTGRDRDHPVIHCELFEQRPIKLRKATVDAHAEFLKNERILDLEDQVRSLVEQINKIKADKTGLENRLRDCGAR
jgi:hypothetical protein